MGVVQYVQQPVYGWEVAEDVGDGGTESRVEAVCSARFNCVTSKFPKVSKEYIICLHRYLSPNIYYM